MADFRYSAGIDVNLNIKGASSQLQELQKQLAQISNMKIDIGTGNLTADIEKASEAAMKLSAHLATATNPKTGNLDFTKFYTSIQKSGASLQEYGEALQKMGPAGQKAFVSLADSISKSEIPLKRTSQMVDKMWDGLKRTASWQLQSSVIHGIMGSIQSAVGYAKDLNSSLNDIRIVTGQSTEQMAQFAKQANQAAKSLSTTTTDYTKASLIYYQQGLSDAEVKQRTEATIKMANVSGQSAQNVSSQMTAIWNNFDNGSKSLQYYGDVITALGAKTAASSEEIAQGIQKFAAISDTIGLSYEYAASALATVTATTRESADIVGNSYKTLFSRIQGLQLGETLDDGTTLNKYSTALAKVGISIKDSSGNLKDMDSILNEMGSKWETLSKDQQMGLAQTVAGVRQYTQLIALMDNWDTFQQNLQIAKTSSGTLDAQAAIYAESWEAASDRVRASWEGLWDTMINSDSMITMLDGLSGIIEAMDTLATSMGGAGGVLTSFLGIATKLFAPKLSQGLRDTAYNVSMLFGGEERITKQRQNFLANAREKINIEGEFGSLYGENESKARIQIMDKQLQMSQLYADRQNQLNPFQELVNEQYNQAINAQNERVISAANNLDAQRNALFDAKMNTSFIDESLKGIINEQGLDSYLNYTQTALQNKQAQLDEEQARKKYQDYEQQHPNMTQQNTTEYERLYSEWEQANNFLTQSKLALEGDTSTQTAKVALDDFGDALKNVYDIVNSPEAKKSPEYLSNISEALGALGKTGQQNANTDKYIAAAQQALAQNQDVNFDTLFSNLIQSQGTAIGGTGEIGKSLTEYLFKKFGVLVGEDTLRQEQQRADNLRAGQEANLNETTSTDWANTMVQASEAIMFALSAGQSLQALNNSIKQDDITGTITSLITGFGNFAMSLVGFKTLFSQISKIAPKAGKYAAIAATISTLLIPGIEWITDKIKTEKELYNEQVLSANELSQIQAQNQNQHKILQANIQSYQNANKELMALNTNTDDWSNQLYNVNSAAIKLITDNNLVEGEDYSTIGGRYDIKNSALERIEKESTENLQSSKILSDMAQQNLATATNEQQKQNITDNLLNILSPTVGESLLEIGTGLASLVGGLALIGSSGVMTAIMGGTGGLTAPALGPLAYATAGAGALQTTAGGTAMLDGAKNLGIRADNKKELELAMEYLEENGLGILTQSIDEIASTIQISTQTASILKESTGILTDWHNSIQANTEAQKLTTENAVRNIVSMNENISNLEKNDTILKGATEEYTKAAEQETKNLEDFNKKSATDKYTLADSVKNVLGLDNLDNFHWTGDDSARTQLTYSYLDEQGQIKEGAVSYNSIIAARQNQAGMDAVDQYADDMANVYNKLQQNYDINTSNGLFSILAGDNFKSATENEIAQVQNLFKEAFSDIDKTLTRDEFENITGLNLDDIAELTGESIENILKIFESYANSDFKSPISKMLEKFMTTESGQDGILKQWLNKTFTNTGVEINKANEEIFNSMSQKTMSKFYENLSMITNRGGQEAGAQFLDGISTMIATSGINPEDYGLAIDRLMSIDWSSWDAGQQAISIISDLGGSLDSCSVSWQAFTAAMQAVAGAIPDFSGLISQLANLMGALNGMDIGSTFNAETFAAFENRIANFRDYTMRQWDGSYKLMEDPSVIMGELRNQTRNLFEQFEEQRKATETYIGNEQGQLSQSDLANLTFDELVKGIALKSSNSEGEIANQYARALGIEDSTIQQIQQDYQNAANELNTYKTDIEGNVIGRYQDENGNFVTSDTEGANFISIDDVDSATAAIWRNTYDAVEETMLNLKAQGEAIVNQIKEAGTMNYADLTKDQRQAVASTYDTYEAFEAGKDDGSGILTDLETGMLTEEGVMQLESLAMLYPEVSADLEEYRQVSSDATATTQELQAAQQQLEESLAAAEAAKKLGLDYDKVRAKMEELKEINEDNDAFKHVSNSGLAELASEALKVEEAMVGLKKDYKSIMKEINTPATKQSGLKKLGNYLKDIAQLSDRATVSTKDLTDAYQRFIKKHPNGMSKILKGDTKAIADYAEEVLKSDLQNIFKDMDWDAQIAPMLENAQNAVSGLTDGMVYEMSDLPAEVQSVLQQAANAVASTGGDLTAQMEAMSTAAEGLGLEPQVEMVDVPAAVMSEKMYTDVVCTISGHNEKHTLTPVGPAVAEETGGQVPYITFTKKGGGKGGGGGGGSQPKEPKKVANKRKSETVKRYKQNDYKRDYSEKATKSEEQKKDYLYGEKKIEQLEKINKLTQREARITADRIKESREYLVEDRQNLIKYMQKYGFEAEFDADGFLTNYEQAWNKIYQEIAALYEDNLLDEEEEKIEEDLNIKLEELEGALEDYENSLSELADDIEAYEESLYEMYDNKVEALEHKVEFKIELSEDDLEYLDFWIESLGDNIYNAIEAIEAMGAKANALFDGLETYQQGIMDIMSLSEDPLQVWATGGIEGILTQAQVDALRDNRDGLADYMQQLIDLRDEIKDKVLDTFDDWQEKLDSTLTTIEHYTSVLEHFKNMIDVVGKDSLGLSNQFMANLEQSAINQSLDSIDANKAYYDNLVEIQQEAQQKLEEARARGDQSSADHWEEVVQSTTEAMQDAQDALLTSLEDSLNLIAEQFETNMERAVEAFNDAIYAYGGLEGLSNDYSLIRENADLMAADYEKIYELSKITRNINKTLDDTNIIAGKQKLIGLQKEINNLQNSGVELSKYDLEYLQAKYELRLAEIELENAQNAKDTVRLSRDSEGNWSYIYTQNADAVEEAGQKYEDALYEMQKLSQEYLEKMSSSMLDTSSAMMEEISALRIQDFNSYEEYQAEVKRIQDKYAESLKLQENELNKAVSNSQQIYEQDWRNYNLITGYKISESEKWIDAFRESTIGQLLNSDTIMSSFSDTFLGLTEILTKNLADSAVNYFTNIDKAFTTYGTSIEDFGKHVEESTKRISDKSKEAAEDAKTMAYEMNDAFKEIADTVSNWQEQFSGEIDKMLEKIKTLIQDINEVIETSANLQSDNRNSSELIGQDEAIDLLNEQKLWGTWGRSENGALTLNGNATTFTDFNGELIQEIDDKMTEMFNARTGSEERLKLEEEVKELFKQYWLFRDIVDRVYDVTDLQAPKYASLDTGGYTGEWGDSGKFAMLHEKELVLNKDDTKNFLDALNLSKDVINSMIEMNAKQSSLALGNLVPTSIQDMSQVLEQSVTIQAEFPNAVDHSEIEEAFNNLINTASQYANRKK